MCEEFLLKWNDYQSSFSSMMESLCLSDEMVDCTITAGGGSRSYSAHRVILSTCSAYFRSLFSTVAPHQHPVLVLHEMDEVVLELLVRYMYSGQVSVTEEQLVPLVQAAKTLGIKGLVDVPVEDRVREAQQQEEQPAPAPSPPPPRRGCLKVKSASSLLSPVLRPVSRIGEVEVFPAPDTGTNGDMDTADIKEEETGDTSTADTEQSQLLRRLTSEVTATSYPLAADQLLGPQIYSCEHCGKEFTSKRKNQRHVLNVHFGYNPVQCPFCNKGHRDNYNLKQHVCPVLNMKYGVFEKKELEGGGAGASGLLSFASHKDRASKPRVKDPNHVSVPPLRYHPNIPNS